MHTIYILFFVVWKNFVLFLNDIYFSLIDIFNMFLSQDVTLHAIHGQYILSEISTLYLSKS